MVEILQGTPRWVFAAFALTLFFGVSACFESRQRRRDLVLTPLIFLGLSVYFLVFRAASPLIPAAIFTITAFAGGGIAVAIYKDVNIKLDPATDRIIYGGEYKLLGIFLAVFLLKFVLGYQQAIDPPSSENLYYKIADVGISGLLIGFLLGRCGTFLKRAQQVNSSQ